MIKRTITGACLVAVITGFFLLRRVDALIFDILITFFSFMGAYEVARCFKDTVKPYKRWIAVGFSTLIPLTYALLGGGIATLIVLAGLVSQLAIAALSRSSRAECVLSILSTLYPSALLLMMSAVNHMEQFSTLGLLFIFVVAPCTDTFAYLIGSALKGPKLCPRLSPKKTVSGAVGGLVGGLAGAALLWVIFKYAVSLPVPPLWFMMVVGLVASALTEIGDLFESYIKRRAGVKDMGKLLPGHGGIMDRIDGIIFVCPLVFVCFTALLPLIM